MKKYFFLIGIVTTVFFSSCTKTDTFSSADLNEYNPTIVGKYIVYNLDSTKFINFGTKDTVIKYQVKFQVDAAITDNLNRPAYRVFRYIRKTAADSWQPDNSFLMVNTTSSLEFVENNMRFIKLKQPIRSDFSWKGNVFIDTYSADSEVKYLDDWEYTYENINEPLTLGAITLDSTITVNQRNEIVGDPSNVLSYSELNIGVEKYAKNIGLVYKNFLHREYQPPTTIGGTGYALGYGITLTMIDHN
ncbi:hypothetical protein LK994_01835 [Ferruginibacter lapsinanis]|uniref:hypothetical protein n=1 Tax=Ferruginibacter lapsinanis TaxID=563172 RepID=UPI001E557462|nr:hypothetical protein [Ferruginibacter lapsinanis]UEG50214.1 hypothetical protein LK994_01835 [Ferruginibacter lapsinanis]